MGNLVIPVDVPTEELHMNKIKTGIAIAAFTLLTPLAQASGLVNGGFEDSTFSGAFQTIGTGSGLNGWSVDSGSVDLINTYWSAASGNYSLDLNGASAATISQMFATTIGQNYTVSFDMAGNFAGGGNKIITAGVTGDHTFTFDISGKSSGNMGWTAQSFTFQAVSALSTLHFSGDSSNTYYGAALDNISVAAAVPEPETYGMMLAGLALLGAIARRKKAAA
jgi:choice-of-anchor C domain-containing protein